jgi:hypothetical protein
MERANGRLARVCLYRGVDGARKCILGQASWSQWAGREIWLNFLKGTVRLFHIDCIKNGIKFLT